MDGEPDISLRNSVSEISNREFIKQRVNAVGKCVPEQSPTVTTLLLSIINTPSHVDQKAVPELESSRLERTRPRSQVDESFLSENGMIGIRSKVSSLVS